MNRNALVGKTVARIHQSRFEMTSGNKVWSLDAIEFTDGSFLQFGTIEGEADYGTIGIYPARPPKKRTT